MNNRLLALLALLTSLLFVPAHALERGTEAEALALVHKAIEYFKKNGLDKTIASVNDLHGPFIRHDLYITITDLRGRNLAHGGNHRIVGVDLIDLRDTDGRYLIRERIALVKAQGKGWQDYRFTNPGSGQIEPKSAYSELIDELIFTCGAYQALPQRPSPLPSTH
jgi:cytochrome c